jgi:hypothetical protein
MVMIKFPKTEGVTDDSIQTLKCEMDGSLGLRITQSGLYMIQVDSVKTRAAKVIYVRTEIAVSGQLIAFGIESGDNATATKIGKIVHIDAGSSVYASVKQVENVFKSTFMIAGPVQ